MRLPPYLAKQIQLLQEYIFFKYLLAREKIRHRRAVKAAAEMALQLEKLYLRPLLKKQQQWVSLLIPANENRIKLDRGEQAAAVTLTEIPELIQLFTRQKIKKIRLDTRLESGQICEAFMVLWQASPRPRSNPAARLSVFIHSSDELAARLMAKDGIHKFCARMRWLPAEDSFQIEYSYCELYYTRVLNLLLRGSAFKQGHRALFSLAPKAGITAGFLIFLLIRLPAASYIQAITGGLLAGTAISYLISTMASILYDQEHKDLVLAENMRDISALSHFPSNNPHPIIKIKNDGELLYHNPASAKLLAELGLPAHHVHEILPADYKELACTCLDRGESAAAIEINRHNRTFRYQITQFPNEQAVMFAGTDITRLKELELELLQLNHNLENKVVARTQELQQTQDVTIMSLSALAELRDPETGAHINRTRRYVRLLAETLRRHPKYRAELDNDEIIDLLYRSAPLHDIGKVGIADAILLKPGPLTSAEFAEMKKHPVIGGDSLRWAAKQLGSNSFLRYAREIAYTHHEKWDGSGYPAGLAGENIPISGRLMALADVYDALVNKRVYKEAFSHDKAKEIIVKGRGKHFDPDIVDAFIEQENEFHEIASKFKS